MHYCCYFYPSGVICGNSGLLASEFLPQEEKNGQGVSATGNNKKGENNVCPRKRGYIRM